jgi:hypothetical protein
VWEKRVGVGAQFLAPRGMDRHPRRAQFIAPLLYLKCIVPCGRPPEAAFTLLQAT